MHSSVNYRRTGADDPKMLVKIEYERKFLLTKLPDSASYCRYYEIVQAYLKDEATGDWIRIRREGGSGGMCTLSIKRKCSDDQAVKKGSEADLSAFRKIESERRISEEEFERMLEKSDRVVLKTRYEVPVGRKVAEIDVYHGKLVGLLTVEVEFSSMEELRAFKPPEWFGPEISGDKRYRNRKLAKYGIPGPLPQILKLARK